MSNGSEFSQIHLNIGILSALRGEMLRCNHSQMDDIIQNVATDIAQRIMKMDQLLESNIHSARRRYKSISRLAHEREQFLIKKNQQESDILIDTEIRKIAEASQRYNIPVDIVQMKESILQLVRKK